MAEDQQPKQVDMLVWGVKQSFRAYVAAVGGVTTPGGGAARDAEGAFTFAAAAGCRYGAMQTGIGGDEARLVSRNPLS